MGLRAYEQATRLGLLLNQSALPATAVRGPACTVVGEPGGATLGQPSRRPDSLPLSGEAIQSKIWVPVVMAQHPNPEAISPDVIEEVVRKALEITPSKSAPIKMEAARILGSSPDPDLKLCEEVLAQPFGNIVVLPQDFV